MHSAKSISCALFVFLMIWGCLCLAEPEGGIPDLGFSKASLAYQGSESLILLVVPDGSGPPFAEARTSAGVPADARITLRLADNLDIPIYLFPREDIWIQTVDRSLPFCGIFNPWPEEPTDREGLTHWIAAPRGGGSSAGPIHVYVNGNRLYQAGLSLAVNSPDIDGDLQVGLSDVALFAEDFFGGYDFRSDLFPDGQVNLSDVAPLAGAVGSNCF